MLPLELDGYLYEAPRSTQGRWRRTVAMLVEPGATIRWETCEPPPEILAQQKRFAEGSPPNPSQRVGVGGNFGMRGR